MSTLMLRLAAPLQAWGVDSKFDRRDTQREPTKSAVIGLAAAALGLSRSDSRIAELGRTLRFGVRVEKEGLLLRDYQTVKGKSPYVTQRYYLCDAVFLAGLEGDDTLVDEIGQALTHPVFPLFLGKRSCPPEGRLFLGIRKGKALEEALEKEPRLIVAAERAMRIQIETHAGHPGTWLQRDVPISFNQNRREYGFRSVLETRLRVAGSDSSRDSAEPTTEHDAYAEMEG
ncbi:MAG: type I-E CRISPR-associated protein Cas5/CasD [Eubacteriales bacterium]|nr:type I-E CRISPR-associated protein Cas5/CasD [Eubacteriales bacterium]